MSASLDSSSCTSGPTSLATNGSILIFSEELSTLRSHSKSVSICAAWCHWLLPLTTWTRPRSWSNRLSLPDFVQLGLFFCFSGPRFSGLSNPRPTSLTPTQGSSSSAWELSSVTLRCAFLFFVVHSCQIYFQCRLIIAQMASTVCDIYNLTLGIYLATIAFVFYSPAHELMTLRLSTILITALHLHYGICVVSFKRS